MKKLLLTLVCLLTVSFAGWAEDETPAYSITPSTTNMNKVGAYTSSTKITITDGDKTWVTTGFNNNNLNWATDPLRTGTKTESSVCDATFSTNFAIPEKVYKVSLDVKRLKAVTSSKNVLGDNGIQLLVSSDSNFTEGTTDTYSVSTESFGTTANSTATLSVEIDNQKENAYYRLVFNLPQANDNGWLVVNNVSYYAQDAAPDTRADVTLSFAEKEKTITEGDAFTAPELTVSPAEAMSEVVYSVAPSGICEIDPTTGELTFAEGKTGKVTVSASINGSETYKNASDYYTLTIEPKPIVIEPITLDGTYYSVIFKKDDNDSSSEMTESSYKSHIEEGSEYIASVSDISKAYSGKLGWKFGSSSKGGKITLNLSKAGMVHATEILVNAKNWSTADNATVSINSSEAVSLSNDFELYSFTVDSASPLETITITGTDAKNCRFYIESIYVKYEPVPVISSIMANDDDTFSDPDGIQVDIDIPEAGYRVFYTLDGNNPKFDINGNISKTGGNTTTELKFSTYNPTHASFFIDGETTTIKVQALKDNKKSPVVSKTFTFVENSANILGFMVEVGDEVIEADYLEGMGYSFVGEVDSDPFEMIAIADDGYEVWYYSMPGGIAFKPTLTGQFDGMPIVHAENDIIPLPANGSTYTTYVFTKKNGSLSDPVMLTTKATVRVQTLEAPTFTFNDTEIEHNSIVNHNGEKIQLAFNLKVGQQLYHAHVPAVATETQAPKPARIPGADVTKDGKTFKDVTEDLEDGILTLDAVNGDYHFFIRQNGRDSDVKMFTLDTTVGIEAIDAETGAAVIYDMMGRRVKVENALKGIFIINGKKVIL